MKNIESLSKRRRGITVLVGITALLVAFGLWAYGLQDRQLLARKTAWIARLERYKQHRTPFEVFRKEFGSQTVDGVSEYAPRRFSFRDSRSVPGFPESARVIANVDLDLGGSVKSYEVSIAWTSL